MELGGIRIGIGIDKMEFTPYLGSHAKIII